MLEDKLDLKEIEKNFLAHKLNAEIEFLMFEPDKYCQSRNHKYRVINEERNIAFCEMYMPRINCKYLCIGKICGYDVEPKK